ncbi:hypothetical protein FKM82_002838 [Ascaphus truei]
MTSDAVHRFHGYQNTAQEKRDDVSGGVLCRRRVMEEAEDHTDRMPPGGTRCDVGLRDDDSRPERHGA